MEVLRDMFNFYGEKRAKESENRWFFMGWDKKECTEDKVNYLFVNEFTKLVDDYETRMVSCKNDIKVLERGFWNGNDYLIALEEKKQQKSIEFYKKNHSFYHGFAPEGFNYVVNKDRLTGFSICSYVLKQEITPSLGLKNCISSKAFFIDSELLIEIALYKTILKVIGTIKFDCYFKKNFLRLDPNMSNTPLKKFIESSESLSPGTMFFFANMPVYTLKHPDGQSPGFHCVFKWEKKFTAFGLPSEGVNEDEMVKICLNSFNSSPIDASKLYSENLAKQTKMQAFNDAKGEHDDPEEYLRELSSFQCSVDEFKDCQKKHPQRVGLIDKSIKKINISALKELCAE